MDKRKIGLFIPIFIGVIILTVVLINFVLPLKASMLSGDVGQYQSGEILFYGSAESYQVNDLILYSPSSNTNVLFAKIIEINPDNTFKVIGTESEPIEELDQNSVNENQITGKVVYSISPYVFFPLLIFIDVIIAFVITTFVTKRLNR